MPSPPGHRRKRSRHLQQQVDLLLTPEERQSKARVRSLEQSRQFLGQPDPPQPEPDDFSIPDQQLIAVLKLHADPGACPPPYLLFAAYQDVIAEEHAEVIREHAADCLLCDILLAELEPPEGSLKSEAEDRVRSQIPEDAFTGEVLPELRPLPPLRRLLLVPALIVLALVAGGGIAWMFFNGRQPAPPPAAVPQPIASDSHPVTLDAPELQRVAPLPEPANLPTTTVNGETGIPLPTAADLAPGFAPYNHGDYPVAADKFRTLASTYSNSEMPFLYLGISELELGQNAPAQHDLDHAHKLATPDLLTEIDWYLAISDLRLGLQSEALALLQSLCAMNDNIHHARACAIAHQIDAPSH